MRRLTGRMVRYSATAPAPMPVAARNHPNPTAPTPRRSSAMAGSNATAPPKSTAKRSSEIAPSRIGWLRTKRRPSTASCRLGRSASSGATTRSKGRTRTRRTVTADDGHEHRGRRERHPRVDHVEEPAEHGTEHERALPRERLAGGEPRQATRGDGVGGERTGRGGGERPRGAEADHEEEDRQGRRGVGAGVEGRARRRRGPRR